MPYRVAGQVLQQGALQIVLARGDAVLTVQEGDTLEGGYEVETIRRDRVTLRYLPLDTREDLLVTSSLTLDSPPVSVAPPTPGTAAATGSPPPYNARADGQLAVGEAAAFERGHDVRRRAEAHIR
jgi:hypothetical protein